MDQPQDEHAIDENGKEISPPSAKRARRCIQSKLSWHKPRSEEAKVAVVEQEKGKCEEIEGGWKKKGRSRAKTPKRDLQISQSMHSLNNTRGDAKVVVIEDAGKPQEHDDEGTKKGRKKKPQTRTPQKSPAKNKEAQRSSSRNKKLFCNLEGNKNCEQLDNEQTSEGTPKTSPSPCDSDHGGLRSKKSLNKKMHNGSDHISMQSNTERAYRGAV